MLSNLLQKLHNSLNNLEEHHEHDEEIGANWLNCARCGSSIGSLVNAIHIQVDEDILFLCSDTCYQRYMKSRLSQQIRLASRMMHTMRHLERAKTLATA